MESVFLILEIIMIGSSGSSCFMVVVSVSLLICFIVRLVISRLSLGEFVFRFLIRLLF